MPKVEALQAQMRFSRPAAVLLELLLNFWSRRMTGTSAPNEDNSTFQSVFMEHIGCLGGHAIMSVSGTLEQVLLFWFG